MVDRGEKLFCIPLAEMGNPFSMVAKLAFLPPLPSYTADWQEIVWLCTRRGQKIPACFIECSG